jgi:mannose-6-phosphate isomerase-like protein (cupin superfamily)
MQEGKVVEKMWGTETYLTNTDQYCCKRLHVYDGYVCSRHRHLIKTETFIIESGSGWIEVNARMYKVTVGDHLHIPAGTWHRFWSDVGMVMLEVSTHHDDADVEREINSDKIYTVDHSPLPVIEWTNPQLPSPWYDSDRAIITPAKTGITVLEE